MLMETYLNTIGGKEHPNAWNLTSSSDLTKIYTAHNPILDLVLIASASLYFVVKLETLA